MTAPLFREVEVVLVERVLRAVAASRHALAALGARLAVGSRAAEVRVGDGAAHLGLRGAVGVLAVAEEDADRGQVEGVADAHGLRDGLEVDVGGGHGRVEADPEHPAGLVVVRPQLVLPVGDRGPLAVLEERGGRHVQRVGVVERSTADARPGEHHDVAEQVDALEAEEAEGGGPEVVLDVPGVLGERLAGEAAARLQDADTVALLGQPEGRHRAAEARAHDQHVVVVRGVVLGRDMAHGRFLGRADLGHGTPRNGIGTKRADGTTAGRPAAPGVPVRARRPRAPPRLRERPREARRFRISAV